MRTIKECVQELKTRRNWESVEEIEAVFDEILEIDKAKTDRIVERLENEKSGLTTWAEDEAFKLGIDKAIKIVKAGGVDER